MLVLVLALLVAGAVLELVLVLAVHVWGIMYTLVVAWCAAEEHAAHVWGSMCMSSGQGSGGIPLAAACAVVVVAVAHDIDNGKV